MPRLMGSLATEEKTRTVAEGYRTRRLLWSIWFVSFVWLNETHQMNQINQINKTNQINQIDQMNQAPNRLRKTISA